MALTTNHGDRKAARSTGLVFACAFCALVVSVLVVQRSTAALSVKANAEVLVGAGTLELTDDDAGRSLLDVSALVPGRPIEACIQVHYNGSVVPAAVSLVPTAAGPLAAYLDLSVEQGTGGSYDDCAGFIPEEIVAAGMLSDITGRRHKVTTILVSPATMSFRLTVELVDDGAAQGLETTVELTWEAVPG